jgi:hypothetical protein
MSSCWEIENADYDLCACMKHNALPFAYTDIESILAVWQGENDGDDWRWVVRLKDGRYAFIQGGCDYTGWDCQSWATSEFADSPEEAAFLATGKDLPAGTLIPGGGMGHMLSILTGEYMGNTAAVVTSLLEQIRSGKTTTWRERKDEELGVTSGSVMEEGV